MRGKWQNTTRAGAMFAALTTAMLLLAVLIGACAGNNNNDDADDDANAAPDDDQSDDDTSDDDTGSDDDPGDSIDADYPSPLDVTAHPYVGWVIGVRNIWKDTHGVWTEEPLPTESDASYVLADIAAIDEERAVAVGYLDGAGDNHALILERDENGWCRIEAPETDCDGLSQVVFAGPDDGIVICPTNDFFSWTVGLLYKNGAWTKLMHPLAATIAFEDLQPVGPHEYLVSGYNLSTWICLPLLVDTKQTPRITSLGEGVGGACRLREWAGGRFAFASQSGSPDLDTEFFRFVGGDWSSTGDVLDSLVLRWEFSPGGFGYAVSGAFLGGSTVLYERGTGAWHPAHDIFDAAIVDGKFQDIDARADDHVVVVGSENNGHHNRSRVIVFNGRSWYVDAAMSGVGGIKYVGVSYAPDPGRWADRAREEKR